MIKIYQYFSSGFGCIVQVSYNDGVLCDVKCEDSKLEAIFTEDNTNDKKAFFFVYEVGFLAATKGKVKVTEIKREITFDMFWEKYDYKLSGRFKTEKLWNSLTISDKIQAYDFIKVYEGQMKLNNAAKLYATTYLNQKRWIK